MHPCIPLKDAAYTRSLAKELLSRRLAGTRTHNQAQSNTTCSVTYFASNPRSEGGCAPKLPEAVKASVIACCSLSRRPSPARSVRESGVCTHLIDKEIDQIYQMRGETIGRGGGCSCNAAESSRSRFLISFSVCALYIRNGICG